MQAWNVYFKNKRIDTVFFNADIKDKKCIYDALTGRDGFDSRIVVRKSRK